MNKDCLNCANPIEQVEGKRARLYCNATCKARYFQKTKAKESMVSISKVEYERLLAIEAKYIHGKDVESINKVITKKKRLSCNNEAVNSQYCGNSVQQPIPIIVQLDRLPGESSIDYKIRQEEFSKGSL